MKAMSYKGYLARVEFDAEDEIFAGRIAGIEDVIGPVVGFVLRAPTLPSVYVSGDNASLDHVDSIAARFAPLGWRSCSPEPHVSPRSTRPSP